MVLIGLLFGGGAAGAVGSYKYEQLNQEMRTLNNAMTPVLVELGKIQVAITAMQEDIDELKGRR